MISIQIIVTKASSVLWCSYLLNWEQPQLEIHDGQLLNSSELLVLKLLEVLIQFDLDQPLNFKEAQLY